MKNNKGFTLIEVLVVIGIMTIVSGAIFSFFLFENKIFDKTSNKFDANDNLRNASLMISSELRNSTNLSLIDRTVANNEVTANTASNYMIIDTDGLVKVYRYRTTPSVGYDIIQYGSGISNDINLSYFSKMSSTVLKINLSTTVKNESLSLDNEILLSNMKLNSISIPNSSNQMAIKYTK